MKYLASILLLLLAICPGPVTAQTADTATITLDGYAFGTITGIAHGCPIEPNGRIVGYVGMTVRCPVYAIAADSSFTPAAITAVPADSSRVSVQVLQVPQGTPGGVEGFHPDTLVITVLRSGNWRISLHANPLLFLMIYAPNRPPPQQQLLTPPFVVQQHEQWLPCAYEGGYQSARAKSYSRPLPCPDINPTAGPLPEFDVQWTLPPNVQWVDAQRPRNLLARTLTGPLDATRLDTTLHPVPLMNVGG